MSKLETNDRLWETLADLLFSNKDVAKAAAKHPLSHSASILFQAGALSLNKDLLQQDIEDEKDETES